jgi:MacB-like periplasmic core domain
MKTLRARLARLAGLFNRDSRDRDLAEELASHVALHMDDNLRSGMTPEEARRAAYIRLGGVESVKETVREQRGFPVIESFLRDIRYSLRGLRRDRAFALTAIVTLALAIGLHVTVFAVMNTMVFRGFPLVQRNDRLVYLQEKYPSGTGGITYLDFEDWRAQAHSFEGMAFVGEKNITLSCGAGRSLDASAFTVSTNAFGLLRVKPALGRDFLPADEASGAAPVVILNHRFWESQLGGRRDVIGASIAVNKAPATVIGVMPEGFDFPTQFDVWMPYTRAPEANRRGPTPGAFLAFGRLRDGANQQEARAELEIINHRLEAAYPATNHGVVPRVDTWSQSFIGPDAPIIYGSLWAAAWFVLLIACANLANLSVARTVGQWRDFSIRIALGAGRGRMMRQIFVESLMLTSVAGVLGWWIVKWGRAHVGCRNRLHLPDTRLHVGRRHAGLVGCNLPCRGDPVFPGSDGQSFAAWCKQRSEKRRPGRYAESAWQTPGGGTGCRPDGARHRSAIRRRRPGSESHKRCERRYRRTRSRKRTGWSV